MNQAKGGSDDDEGDDLGEDMEDEDMEDALEEVEILIDEDEEQ